MCGIVGVIGNTPVADRILNSLRTLEYRGYDSAGIATLDGGLRHLRKAVGKLSALADAIDQEPLAGDIGIGHTRWATHGAPSLVNSHPHISGSVSVVHNGIIENYAQLRQELIEKGYQFQTETDTETVAVLIDDMMASGMEAREAFRATLSRLEGAFSLGVIIEDHDILMAARRGSPLAIGYGDGENYIGSDAIALAGFTGRVTFLDDGDWAVITRDHVEIFDALDHPANREIRMINIDQMIVSKGRHRHFMAKEIHEQPTVLSYVLSHYLNATRDGFDFSNMEALDFSKTGRICLVACGTASLACFVAKYWIESWAKLPCDVEIASEFRYREPPLNANDTVIFVSQSGETADTLAALMYVKTCGARTIGIVNAEESSIAREVDIILPLKAGVELSVASTKAFTAQLMVLAVISLICAKTRDQISAEDLTKHVKELETLPRLISEVFAAEPAIRSIAHELAKASDVLFLGRGALYPIALEGALKLKEITYIHAEGYAAGELKHGPIALVDDKTPIVVFAPYDRLFEKVVSNMQEVAARDGKIILITDAEGAARMDRDLCKHIIEMPTSPESIAPMLQSVPVQLLAYHTAVEKGTDVDQPRNLAKSVTVE